MPPEPVSHETLIQNFIAPCDKVLSERVAILATIYGSVMAGGQGYYDERIVMAKSAMGHFLEAITPA